MSGPGLPVLCVNEHNRTSPVDFVGSQLGIKGGCQLLLMAGLLTDDGRRFSWWGSVWLSLSGWLGRSFLMLTIKGSFLATSCQNPDFCTAVLGKTVRDSLFTPSVLSEPWQQRRTELLNRKINAGVPFTPVRKPISVINSLTCFDLSFLMFQTNGFWTSIHPFSIPASFEFWVAGVCWSLSQLPRGERRGPPWIGRQPIAGLTLKDRHSLSLTPTVSLDWSIHLASMSLDRGRKHGRRRENMQTPRRKASANHHTTVPPLLNFFLLTLLLGQIRS